MRMLLCCLALMVGCGNKAELEAARKGEQEAKARAAALEGELGKVRSVLEEARRGLPESAADDDPMSVRDGMRYIAALKTAHLHDPELRDNPANSATSSETMGCQGILICPSDLDVLSIASKAKSPSVKEIMGDVHAWRDVAVMYTGEVLGISMETARQGPALTGAALVTPQGPFIAYGRYPTDFKKGDRVEVVGVLGFLQQVKDEQGVPTIAMMAMLRAGSVDKIRAKYSR